MGPGTTILQTDTISLNIKIDPGKKKLARSGLKELQYYLG
jgi:hypothetical protein